MKQLNGIFKITYSAGEFLILFLKLQLFWLLFTIKGGIVLGFFPATATVIQAFFHAFENRQFPNSIYQFFKSEYKKHFKQSNQLGWLQAFILLVLWIDLRVASNLLHNRIIHLGLIGLFSIAMILALYLLPVFLRYQLKLLEYFKQAFFLAISSFFETVAIVLGIFIAVIIASFFPILLSIASIPLLYLPVSWFSLQAMRRIEHNNLEKT